MSIGQAPACPGGTLYTIRPGDTLFALASRFNTTITAILTANPRVDPNNLQVRQIICIPGAPGPGPCPGGTIYVVQPGDTLFLIAQRFGIPLQTLIAANPGIDPLRLQIGQTLCIPGLAPPIPAGPCCRILTPLQPFPPTEVPFPPAGVLLVQIAGPGFTAVTFAVSGLPDPEVFGEFDAYIGRVILPPPSANAAPDIFMVNLTPARSFEQPVVWAGSRIIQRLLTEETTATIHPFNTGTGVAADPILRGTAGPCR